jgi:hypothetical protein
MPRLRPRPPGRQQCWLFSPAVVETRQPVAWFTAVPRVITAMSSNLMPKRQGRGPADHQTVQCRAEGRRSSWYRPRREPDA